MPELSKLKTARLRVRKAYWFFSRHQLIVTCKHSGSGVVESFTSIGFKYSSLIAKLPVRLCDGWVDVNSFWCLIKRGGIPYQVIDIVISSCTISVITCSLSVWLDPQSLHKAPHITSPYRLLGLLHVHWTAAFYVTDFI